MQNTKHIIFLILFVKLCTFFLIFFAFSFFPFNKDTYAGNFHFPLFSPITLQTAFSTWDAQHYLYISEKGYAKHADSDAFPSFFPFLIFVCSLLTHNSFWSGILLSNIFSLVALTLFYLFVESLFSEKVAYRSLVFLLAFPTAFYFSLIYTESLFFLLVILFFIFLQRKQLFLASAMAFLLPITRLIGIAIIFPFLSSYILEYHGHSLYDEVVLIAKSFFSKKTLYLCAPLGGLGVAMTVMYLATGNWLTQFTVQQNFISQYSLLHIFNPLFFLQALATFPLQIHGFTNSLLDRLFFVWFVCMLPFVFKRVSVTLFVYALIFGLVSVLSGSFMSYMRYLVVVFPLFLTLGKMSLEKTFEQFTFPLLYFFIFLQSVFILMQALNYWVA